MFTILWFCLNGKNTHALLDWGLADFICKIKFRLCAPRGKIGAFMYLGNEKVNKFH